ncbi:MAG: NAD(P)(+) transhydrogenase (Re/Si-specific) subunit beta [Pseudanabaenaceae cyanobacterium SKYGB_i_bin29]|nr:NAD(P)(+) transhydrogenase (Re/Si-specific) subunit beta [Pseudanabaenaceae cyanobacterium SKYG29]MDW8421455.1 NAD(P)(+) transhydrogenase (Re/Si-specific) subunit beta [Pseudanabaenaceae cyanobacterium SKYGB_i_bin29]
MADFLPSAIQLAYLAAVGLFILGLKRMSSPATARQGNILGAVGMFLAVGATLLDQHILNYTYLAVGLAIGSALGVWIAYGVAMTDMPQMVGFLNGLGGLASSLVAVGEYWRLTHSGTGIPIVVAISILLSVLIGNVTFTGSMVAFAKLQGIMPGTPIKFVGQQWVNGALLVGFLIGSGWILFQPDLWIFLTINLIALVVGVLLVVPIGGGDMPVVISLLNSFSGLAGSAAGFVVMNNILIVAGALVGASGLILTQIMCKAMNRSLLNVLFSGFGSVTAAGAAAGQTQGTIRQVDAEEAAMIMGYARSVVIVPGYGMAVAQAQHAVRELAEVLEKLGVDVKYAIHPVAGRMPGHMNVLLAEANVPYSQLYDMDDINPQFPYVDVALVIGANDVVNPSARTAKDSPIYGMPILEVDRAKHTIVIKRGMNKGFAGVENELFFKERTMMLFGNAKETVMALTNALKELEG